MMIHEHQLKVGVFLALLTFVASTTTAQDPFTDPGLDTPADDMAHLSETLETLDQLSGEPADFWDGLWHGVLSPVTFVSSWFSDVEVFSSHYVHSYEWGCYIGMFLLTPVFYLTLLPLLVMLLLSPLIPLSMMLPKTNTNNLQQASASAKPDDPPASK